MKLRMVGFAFLSFRGSGYRLLVFSAAFLLGLALIVSQGLASAIAGRTVLDQITATLSYHYFGDVRTSRPQLIDSDLQSIPGIRSATYVFLAGSLVEARTADSSWRSLFVYGVSPDFAAEAHLIGWDGDIRLSPGNVTVSSGLAAALGVEIGQVVSLGRNICDPFTGDCEYRNVTYTISSLVVRSKDDRTSLTSLFIAFVQLADALAFYEFLASGPLPENPNYSFLAWVDTDEVLLPLDPAGNLGRISRIQHELELKAGGASFEAPIRESLESFESRLIPLQALFLALSVPALLLALAVSLEALSRTTTRAVLSIRLFRVRGVSKRTGQFAVMIPGFVSAASCLLAGIFGFPWLFAFLFGRLGLTVEVEGLGATTLSAGIAFLLLLFVLFSRQVRFRLEIATAKWQGGSNQVSPGLASTVDYALLVSGVSLWLYVGLFEIIKAYAPAFDSLVGSVFRVLAPAATVLVTLGVVRPLLQQRSIRSGLVAPFRRMAGPLGRQYLASRFVAAAPRAGVPLVVALAVALMLVGSVALHSENTYNEKRLAAAIGGDLRIEALGNGSIGSALAALDGITRITEVEITSPFVSLQHRIIAVNTSGYHSVVGADPYFFGSVGGDIRALLEGKHAVLVNAPAAERSGITIGDTVSVFFGNRSALLTVSGIINAMPGLLPNGLSSLIEALLYADLPTLYNVVFPGARPADLSEWRFLLKTAQGTSLEELRASVLAAFPSQVLEISTRTPSGDDPLVDIAAAFLAVETYVSAILVLMALSMLAATLLSERELEVAAIRVRGAGRLTVARFLWGELASTTTLGLFLGVGIGMVGSVFLVQALSKFIDQSVLVRPWIVTAESVGIALLLGITSLAILFLVAWRASVMDSVRIFKERAL